MGYELAITSGVPIPPKKGRHNKYPFRLMQAGDFFFIPAKLRDIQAVQHKVSAAAMQFTKKNAGCNTWKFCTRQIVEAGIPGVGVWRKA